MLAGKGRGTTNFCRLRAYEIYSRIPDLYQAGHFRINFKVIGAYLGVSLLHGLWDGLPDAITAFFGQGLDVFLGEAFVAIAGLFILWRRWEEAKHLQMASIATLRCDNQANLNAYQIHYGMWQVA